MVRAARCEMLDENSTRFDRDQDTRGFDVGRNRMHSTRFSWSGLRFVFVVSLACAQGEAGQVHRRARVSLLRNYWFLRGCWNANRDFDKLDLANVICTGVRAE